MEKSWSQLLQVAKTIDAEKQKPEPATFEQLFQIEILLQTTNLQLEKIWMIDNQFLNYNYDEAETTLNILRQNQITKSARNGNAYLMRDIEKSVKWSVENPKS